MSKHEATFLQYAEMCTRFDSIKKEKEDMSKENEKLRTNLKSALEKIAQLSNTIETMVSIKDIWNREGNQ